MSFIEATDIILVFTYSNHSSFPVPIAKHEKKCFYYDMVCMNKSEPNVNKLLRILPLIMLCV